MARVFFGSLLLLIALVAMFTPLIVIPGSGAYSLENLHATCASTLVRLVSGQRCGNADFAWYLTVAAGVTGAALVTWGLTKD